MDLLNAATFEKTSLVGFALFMAVLVITGRLVWYTQVNKLTAQFKEQLAVVEARALRWEGVALEALSAGAEAGVKAAETTVAVVSALPDPVREQQGN